VIFFTSLKKNKKEGDMTYANILYEVKDGVARITINRPPYNVLDIPTMREMVDALQDVKARQGEVKVLVIGAAGEKAFSTGVDVKDHTPDKMDEMIEVFHRIFRTMAAMEIPTVAAVKGYALGGGCEVALFCDMVVASETAQFGQPEIKVGVYPSMVVAWLPRITGMKKAMEIILTGDPVSASEAKALGLVNLVVPPDKFDEELEKFLERLKDKSPIVLRIAKRAILAGMSGSFEEGLENSEVIYKHALMKTYDANEGLKAFLEKRKPEWKGE